jgi:hypothetical protein
MKTPILFMVLYVISTAAFAGKTCEDLKTEIAAKIDANHVASYTLDIVAADQVGDRKVVGSCEAGAKKIVYTKNIAPTDAAAPAAADAPADSADKK